MLAKTDSTSSCGEEGQMNELSWNQQLIFLFLCSSRTAGWRIYNLCVTYCLKSDIKAHASVVWTVKQPLRAFRVDHLVYYIADCCDALKVRKCIYSLKCSYHQEKIQLEWTNRKRAQIQYCHVRSPSLQRQRDLTRAGTEMSSEMFSALRESHAEKMRSGKHAASLSHTGALYWLRGVLMESLSLARERQCAALTRAL